MNQILATQKEKKKNGKKKANIKKVIQFSCTAMILFGIIMVGQGIWNLYDKNHTKEEIDIPNTILDPNTQDNNNSNNSSGNTQIQVSPDQTTKINLSVVGNNLKIVATNGSGLESLLYRWNNGEDIEVYPKGEDRTIIEKEIEIPIGRNTITIVAIDMDNNQEIKECDIVGTTKPEIKLTRDGKKLVIHVVDKEEIVYVEFTVNENKYRLNIDELTEEEAYKQVEGLSVSLSEAGRINEITYKQNLLQPGDNTITVMARNKYGTTSQITSQSKLEE